LAFYVGAATTRNYVGTSLLNLSASGVNKPTAPRTLVPFTVFFPLPYKIRLTIYLIFYHVQLCVRQLLAIRWPQTLSIRRKMQTLYCIWQPGFPRPTGELTQCSP